MPTVRSADNQAGTLRPPAVAGAFYPAAPSALIELVDSLLAEAARRAPVAGPDRARQLAPDLGTRGRGQLVGLLVPHAGLVYSGVVAAAAWRLLAVEGAVTDQAPVVILGTNHSAGWLDGVGIWESGAWQTPIGDLAVDEDLAAAILGLGSPFTVDRPAHRAEHSIEVQLPLLRRVAAGARIVPLAVGTGSGPMAVAAGRRLGTLLAARRAAGQRVLLVVSSDMAHYPPAGECDSVTRALAPLILELDATGLAAAEAGLRLGHVPGLVCGMCGIEPAVLGLAALEAMGATGAEPLLAATSADAGGDAYRTVGYLAVAFRSGAPESTEAQP